jgi:hypothetical protein
MGDLAAAMKPKLREQVVNVRFRRRQLDSQSAGDLLVAEPFGNHQGDLVLTGR